MTGKHLVTNMVTMGIALVPGQILKGKIWPGTYHMGDSTHALLFSPESGESLLSLIYVSIYVK